ncbi:4'-phosphopantetheinyl transferase family protein [Pseudarthrobacter sp. J1763]|uniref:4'-phosphopantetheinyl transferase family protein n=1 Tax=Pseudarthrobacter sp. J1763 TaxID=3420445 RepID=UPI003D2C5BB1
MTPALEFACRVELDAAEWARADRLLKHSDAQEFLLARLFQRRWVSELLGVRPEKLVTAYFCPDCSGTKSGGSNAPDHGRPGYLYDGVRAPIALSASRAAGWAVFAAAISPPEGFALGVDVEDPAAIFSGFDSVALTDAERALVVAADSEKYPRLEVHTVKQRLRANFWAKKEAFLKLRGTGLRTDPATIDTTQLRGVRTMSAQESGLPEQLVAAVALAG